MVELCEEFDTLLFLYVALPQQRVDIHSKRGKVLYSLFSHNICNCELGYWTGARPILRCPWYLDVQVSGGLTNILYLFKDKQKNSIDLILWTYPEEGMTLHCI